MSSDAIVNHSLSGCSVLNEPWHRSISRLLLLLLIVGGSIAFIDGITSRYNDDWEYVQVDTLTYKPATAAMIFAVATLPLVFGSLRAQKVSKSECLLLWYLLGVTAYTKDFAYLKIPGVPIYITDYVLGFLLIRHFLWPRPRWYSLRSWPMFSAAALITIGVLASLRGIFMGQSVLLVVRDFGLVVYVLYLPIGILVFRNWPSIRRMLLIFCVGSAILSLFAIGYAISNPGQRRYVLYPVLLAAGFVASFAGMQNNIFDRKLGWTLTITTASGLLLANARTEFVAVLAVFAFMFFFGPSVQRTSMISRFKLLLKFSCIAVVLFATLLQTKTGSAFAGRVVDDFLSGILNPGDDPTAQFRFLAWTQAIEIFVEHPVLGQGYGVPFTFGSWETDPRPHNTYLTFLYKTGATGFAALAITLGVFFLKTFTTSRLCLDKNEAPLLYIIGLALIAVCSAGFFTFLFESPFVSAPFWLLVAAGYRSLNLLGQRLTIGKMHEQNS